MNQNFFNKAATGASIFGGGGSLFGNPSLFGSAGGSLFGGSNIPNTTPGEAEDQEEG